MGKSKKRSNPGVGVDFRKVKHKVGKKLPKAKNDTKTDFQSRSINLPSQSVAKDRTGAAVSDHNLTLEELVAQLGHHNSNARCNALAGLQQLITTHPKEATKHAALLLEALAAHIPDGEQAVRTALLSLLRSAVLPAVGPAVLTPFVPMLMAHLSAALTHLSADVRYDALAVLEVITAAAPHLMIAEQPLQSAMAHYTSLLSRANRGKSVKSQALSGLMRTLSSLERFLAAAMTATAAADTGHSGSSYTAETVGSNIAGPLLSARAYAPAAQSSVRPPSAAVVSQLCNPRAGQQQQQSGCSSPLQQQCLQLLNVLFDCWSEAAPGSLCSAPESESAQVLVHILACCRLLLGRLNSSQLTPAAATGSAPSINPYGPAAAWAVCAVSPTGQSRSLWEVEAAAAVVLPRLLAVFPVPQSAGNVTPQLQQLLQRFNLLAMQISTFFVASGVQWPVTGAQTAATAQAAAASSTAGVQVAGSDALLSGNSSKAGGSKARKRQLAMHDGWQDRFVSFLSDVLAADGEWLSTSNSADNSVGPSAKAQAVGTGQVSKKQQPDSSSSSILVALQCLQQLMPHMPRQQRQQLLHAISQHLSPKQQQQQQQQHSKVSSSADDVGSPVGLSYLQLQLQLLLACLSDGGVDPEQESVIASWVAAAPKLLWECGSSKPQCSKLLLSLLYHAAQLARPGSLVEQQLLQVQAQLAPLFAAALAAATPAQKKSLASVQTDGDNAAIPIMLGPLASLSDSLQCLASDALALHTQLQQPILRAVALSCRLTTFNDSAVTRLLDCVLFAAGSRISPELFLSFVATLLSPAPVGGYVDRVTGKQLYAGFSRHCLLTQIVCRHIHSYGPLEASLTALMPLLLQQWQTLSKTGAGVKAGHVTAVRCCSYSCLMLAALAVGSADSRYVTASNTSCHPGTDVSREGIVLPDSIKQQLPLVLASYFCSSMQALSCAAEGVATDVCEDTSDGVPPVTLGGQGMEGVCVGAVKQCTNLLLPLLTADSELLLLPFLDEVVSWAMHDTADGAEAPHADVPRHDTAVHSSTGRRADAIAAVVLLLSVLLQCQALRGFLIQHKQHLEQLSGRIAVTVQQLQQCSQVTVLHAEVQNMQAAIKLLC